MLLHYLTQLSYRKATYVLSAAIQSLGKHLPDIASVVP